MPGAQRSIIVNVPPEKFFDLLVDYERYPEFLPEVKSVRVDKNGSTPVLHYELDLKIKTIRYSLRMQEQRPTKLSWSLVQGDFMKSNQGAWELKPAGEGKTEATYAIEVGLGLLVPKTVSTMLVETSLPAMLQAFKKRAEG